ncbi:protein Bouncer-like isoform X2 [Gymnodraco acuticeps]|nr:protein Bouncer-like isoform X2 [Gymnodraco acuticeps]
MPDLPSVPCWHIWDLSLWKGPPMWCKCKKPQCLTCRQCPIGTSATCLSGKDIQCAANELCFQGELRFNGTEQVSLHKRGCLSSTLCGTLLDSNLLGEGFTAFLQCCAFNLCNGAASVQLSVTAALSAAMLSSLWGLL